MRYLRPFIAIAVLLIAWQILVACFQLPSYILPSPYQVLLSLEHNIVLITHQALFTVTETIVALLLGIFIGVCAALFLTMFTFARQWVLPLIIISQSIPTFAIAPLFVIWFGYGMSSKIMTAILMLFFPVTSTFYDGLKNTSKDYLDLAKVMQVSPLNQLFKIKFPAALPHLASGIRMAAVIAPIGAVVGEWVGSSKGLGYLMLNANARMQIDLMFAVLLIIVLFALALYYSIDCILKKLTFSE